jgi:hypothetical protein
MEVLCAAHAHRKAQLLNLQSPHTWRAGLSLLALTTVARLLLLAGLVKAVTRCWCVHGTNVRCWASLVQLHCMLAAVKAMMR